MLNPCYINVAYIDCKKCVLLVNTLRAETATITPTVSQATLKHATCYRHSNNMLNCLCRFFFENNIYNMTNRSGHCDTELFHCTRSEHTVYLLLIRRPGAHQSFYSLQLAKAFSQH